MSIDNTLPNVNNLLQKMAEDLRQLLTERKIVEPQMLGIHSGGVWIAEALHHQLKLTLPLGELDISFYRDDHSLMNLHPQVKSSYFPQDVEGKTLILVDDVLQTGRTIKAALNEIFEYGRPAAVILVTLLALPKRELPIKADVVGINLNLTEQQRIKVTGPEPLKLELTMQP